MYGQLKNGLRWYAEHNPRVANVAVQLTTIGGSRHDPPGKSGLAHLVEHLFYDGSKQVPLPLLTQPVYSYGGQINAYTTNEYAAYHCKIHPHGLEAAVEFLSECFYHAALKKEDIEKQKQVVCREIMMKRADPYFLFAAEWIPSTLFKDTPIARTACGSASDIQSITREDVVNFVRTYYQPSESTLVIVGNIMGSVQEMVEFYFDQTVKALPLPPIKMLEELPREGPFYQQITYCGHEAVIGFAFPYMSEDYSDAHRVLSHLLLDNIDGVLLSHLRKDHAEVYSIENMSMSQTDCSVFAFACNVKKNKDTVNTVISIVLEELNNIKLSQVSERDITKAISFLTHDMEMGGDDTENIARSYGESLAYNDYETPTPYGEGSKYHATAEEIQQVALQLFKPSNLFCTVFY